MRSDTALSATVGISVLNVAAQYGPGQYTDWRRIEIEPFVPKTARSVLDVGCSFGGFGVTLKDARPHIEVWGVEPNEHAVEIARSRLDGVVHGSFPDDVPDRQFDCLVFNDVLEHLPDPWSTLRASRRLLDAEGRIVASIPNVRHFKVTGRLVLLGRWTYGPSGILDWTHLRFFTRSSMIDLFVDSGFRVESVAPVNITSPKGRIAPLLHLFGRQATEFLAEQYVIVAAPVDEGPPA